MPRRSRHIFSRKMNISLKLPDKMFSIHLKKIFLHIKSIREESGVGNFFFFFSAFVLYVFYKEQKSEPCTTNWKDSSSQFRQWTTGRRNVSTKLVRRGISAHRRRIPLHQLWYHLTMTALWFVSAACVFSALFATVFWNHDLRSHPARSICL